MLANFKADREEFEGRDVVVITNGYYKVIITNEYDAKIVANMINSIVNENDIKEERYSLYIQGDIVEGIMDNHDATIYKDYAEICKLLNKMVNE